MKPNFEFRITGLIMILIGLAVALPASAQMNQQQFTQLKQEYHALKYARAVDENCWLLTSPSRENADNRASEIQSVLMNAGISYKDMVAFETSIKDSVKGKTCAELAGLPDVKTAANMANVSAGMNIYVWQSFFDKYPNGVPGRNDCGGSANISIIKDSMSEHAYLSDIFKASPSFNAMRLQMDNMVGSLYTLCGTDGAFFEYSYNGSALINITKNVIDLHFALELSEQRGYFEKSANSQKWMGFRGAVPVGDFDAQIPWAVLREAREKNPRSTGLSSTFVDNSSVDYGLTTDKRFVVSLRTPSLSGFKSDIFKAVIVRNINTGKSVRLVPTEEFFKPYDTAKMGDGTLKASDLPDTVQFAMTAAQSQTLIKTLKKAEDISIQVERLEAGKTRLVDVETISHAGIQEAMNYAFAPKIEF